MLCQCHQQRQHNLLILLAVIILTIACTSTIALAFKHTSAFDQVPHHHPIGASHLFTLESTFIQPLLLIRVIILLVIMSSVLKIFHIIPYGHRFKADLIVAFFIFSILVVLFFQRLSQVYVTGYINLKTFSQFFLAGGICAFIAHAVCTPIDVIKTRIQTSPSQYRGTIDAFSKIVSDEGSGTLLKGLGATASGYFLHGGFKFSFYELFKVLLSSDPKYAMKPSLPVAAFSGFFAECIACLLLCPMEAIRIRSVADSNFPSGVISGLSLLLKSEGFNGWFKGLPAMLLKQVPYTVGQFVSFEVSVKVIKRIHSLAYLAPSTISLLAGFCAGITAAIISHPGDTILSKINQEQSDGSPISQIVKVVKIVGFSGLFIGLGTRLVQVSFMIGSQFLIYDSIKIWCGILPASAIRSSPVGHSPALPVAASAKSSSTILPSLLQPLKKMR